MRRRLHCNGRLGRWLLDHGANFLGALIPLLHHESELEVGVAEAETAAVLVAATPFEHVVEQVAAADPDSLHETRANIDVSIT